MRSAVDRVHGLPVRLSSGIGRGNAAVCLAKARDDVVQKVGMERGRHVGLLVGTDECRRNVPGREAKSGAACDGATGARTEGLRRGLSRGLPVQRLELAPGPVPYRDEGTVEGAVSAAPAKGTGVERHAAGDKAGPGHKVRRSILGP